MPSRAPLHNAIAAPAPRVRKRNTNADYDAAWRTVRAAYLTQNPYCQCDECKQTSKLTKANVVDHIQPISERPDLRLEWSNLRSMAKRHHDRHTIMTQGINARRSIEAYERSNKQATTNKAGGGIQRCRASNGKPVLMN